MDQGTVSALLAVLPFLLFGLLIWWVVHPKRVRGLREIPDQPAEAAPTWRPVRDEVDAPSDWSPGRHSVIPRRRAFEAAIRHEWDVTITYTNNDGEQSTRRVQPRFFKGQTHVRAYCQMRQDWRTFRLDRIEKLEVHAKSPETCAKYRIN